MAAAYAFAPDSSRVGGGGSAFALGIGTSAIAGGNSCSTTVVLFKNHPTVLGGIAGLGIGLVGTGPAFTGMPFWGTALGGGETFLGPAILASAAALAFACSLSLSFWAAWAFS